METAHRCKLCFRNFANGKALGGHMRSHVMNLCTGNNGSKRGKEENPFENLEDFRSFPSCLSISSQSSSGDEEEKRHNLVKRSVSGYPAVFCSVMAQDRESESDSSRTNMIGMRSKRARKSKILVSDLKGYSLITNSTASKAEYHFETEALSSISGTTSEDEDVAYCLMMLSRDKWRKQGKEKGFEEDYDEEYSDVVKVKKGSSKVKGKYRCKTCNESFRSYQALGGHRASHKKIKVSPTGNDQSTSETGAVGGPVAAVAKKLHKCPFCNRVFASGQALGGHKRSHFVGGGATISKVGETLNIDLNLPAPIDDDNDDDGST